MHVRRKSASNNLLKYVIAGLLIFVVLVAITYPLWIPYFVDEVIDEAFPTSSVAQQAEVIEEPVVNVEPTVEPVLQETSVENTAIPPTAMPPTQEPVADEPTGLVRGSFSFIDAVHNGSGTATVYELADGSRVLRLEDFEVTNGPDLHVILSPNTPDGLLDDVGDYANLGSLKANIGNQNYDIPADLDLSQYQSVVIYCVPFHVVFSAATLDTVP